MNVICLQCDVGIAPYIAYIFFTHTKNLLLFPEKHGIIRKNIDLRRIIMRIRHKPWAKPELEA